MNSAARGSTFHVALIASCLANIKQESWFNSLARGNAPKCILTIGTRYLEIIGSRGKSRRSAKMLCASANGDAAQVAGPNRVRLLGSVRSWKFERPVERISTKELADVYEVYRVVNASAKMRAREGRTGAGGWTDRISRVIENCPGNSGIIPGNRLIGGPLCYNYGAVRELNSQLSLG